MNVQGLFAGHTDTPLTETGRKQAIKAGKKAKDLGIDVIVSSPLSRALDTAKHVAEAIGYDAKNIVTHNLFMERFYGKMEGMPYAPNLRQEDMKDAETTDDLLVRARKALDYLESLDADHILVVSHGAFGRALRHHAKKDFPFSRFEKIPNAEILELI